jgi:hypothetical protein
MSHIPGYEKDNAYSDIFVGRHIEGGCLATCTLKDEVATSKAKIAESIEGRAMDEWKEEAERTGLMGEKGEG